nr:MAG TPA: hypothetical protein [Caudoviricetes sp.]
MKAPGHQLASRPVFPFYHVLSNLSSDFLKVIFLT